MFTHIVHVMRKSPDSWAIRCRGTDMVPASRPRAYNGVTKRNVVTMIQEITENAEQEMETWYCDSQATADAVASEFASRCPGVEIYVATTTAIYICNPGKVKVANVSEKGLVPQ